MTWLRGVKLPGPRRFAVGRPQRGRRWEGGPAESYSAGGGAAASPSSDSVNVSQVSKLLSGY